MGRSAKSRELSEEFRKEFVIKIGGKSGKEAILYNGLLALAHEDERFGHIESRIVQFPNGDNKWTAYAEATIHDKQGRIIGQEGADANAANCGKMTAASFPRMALTRAKSRAFRDFLNIGMVSSDELGGEGVYEPEKASPEQIGKIKRLGKENKIKKNELYDILYDEGHGAEEFNELTPEGAEAVIKYLKSYEEADEDLDDDEEFEM